MSELNLALVRIKAALLLGTEHSRSQGLWKNKSGRAVGESVAHGGWEDSSIVSFASAEPDAIRAGPGSSAQLKAFNVVVDDCHAPVPEDAQRRSVHAVATYSAMFDRWVPLS